MLCASRLALAFVKPCVLCMEIYTRCDQQLVSHSQAEAEEKLQSLVLKQVRKRVRLVLDGENHTPPTWSVGILVAYMSKRNTLARPRHPRPSKRPPSAINTDKHEVKRRRKTQDHEAAGVDKAKRRRKKNAQQTAEAEAKAKKIAAMKRRKDAAGKAKCKPNSKTTKSHSTLAKIKKKSKAKAAQEPSAAVRKFPPRRAGYNRIQVRVTGGRYHCVHPTQSGERKTSKARSSLQAKKAKSNTSSKKTAAKASAKVAERLGAATQPKRRGRPPAIKIKLSRGKSGEWIIHPKRK